MKLSIIQKRAEKAINSYRKEQAKLLKRKLKLPKDEQYWIEPTRREAEHGTPFTLRYVKTRGEFVNYKNSCAIDLVNEYGHSYNWYCLFKRIKGKLVLNSYRYSNQTTKHINHCRNALNTLGIKYIEIEAPCGLQDLDVAKAHAVYLMGKAVVENKYGRIKSRYSLNYATKLIKRLRSIGIFVTEASIKGGVARAEEARREKLDRMKERRAELQFKGLTTVVFQNTPQLKLIK